MPKLAQGHDIPNWQRTWNHTLDNFIELHNFSHRPTKHAANSYLVSHPPSTKASKKYSQNPIETARVVCLEKYDQTAFFPERKKQKISSVIRTNDQKHKFNHVIIKYMVVTTNSHHSKLKSTIGKMSFPTYIFRSNIIFFFSYYRLFRENLKNETLPTWNTNYVREWVFPINLYESKLCDTN